VRLKYIIKWQNYVFWNFLIYCFTSISLALFTIHPIYHQFSQSQLIRRPKHSLQIVYTTFWFKNHLGTPPTHSTSNQHHWCNDDHHHPPQFPNKLTVCTLSQIVHHLWNPLESFVLDFDTRLVSPPQIPIKTRHIESWWWLEIYYTHPDLRHPPPRLVLHLFTTRQPTYSHPSRNGLSVRWHHPLHPPHPKSGSTTTTSINHHHSLLHKTTPSNILLVISTNY
jgi:hypothetical protein